MALETGHQACIKFLLILVLKTDKGQYKKINQLIKKGCDQVDFGKAKKKPSAAYCCSQAALVKIYLDTWG